MDHVPHLNGLKEHILQTGNLQVDSIMQIKVVILKPDVKVNGLQNDGNNNQRVDTARTRAAHGSTFMGMFSNSERSRVYRGTLSREASRGEEVGLSHWVE